MYERYDQYGGPEGAWSYHDRDGWSWKPSDLGPSMMELDMYGPDEDEEDIQRQYDNYMATEAWIADMERRDALKTLQTA